MIGVYTGFAYCDSSRMKFGMEKIPRILSCEKSI